MKKCSKCLARPWSLVHPVLWYLETHSPCSGLFLEVVRPKEAVFREVLVSSARLHWYSRAQLCAGRTSCGPGVVLRTGW